MLTSVLKHRSLLRNIPAFLRKSFYSTSSAFNVNDIQHPTKVPLKPVVSLNAIPSEKISIDQQTIELLIRLSLVNITDEEALKTLEDSIEFASKILHVDTAGVEPMYFVHEHQYLALRDDIVTEGDIREELLENAPTNDDTCFVAPPGNIPVELEEQEFKSTTNK